MQEHVSFGGVAQGRWSLGVNLNTTVTHKWKKERMGGGGGEAEKSPRAGEIFN